MNDVTIRRTGAALALAALLAPAALAQPGEQPRTIAAEAERQAPRSFTWSNPAVEEFATAFSGTWRSTVSVNARGTGEQVSVLVSVAPILVEGLRDTLYVEAAPADAPNEPFRQTVVQVREGDQGGVRLRTFEIGAETFRNMVRGAWALDRPLALLDVANLVPTMDIALRREGRGGYAGSTEHAYPTMVGGAETMTSAFRLTGDQLVLADRGLDAEGNIVWGPAEGEQGFTFRRAEAPVTRQDRESGLVIIDIGTSESPTLAPGDQFFANYAGWTLENGLFDTSYYPGRQPIRARLPQPGEPGGLIQGWLEGLDGAPLDIRRFLIIPADLGYGEQGRPQAGIEPNATLFFAVELDSIQKPTGQMIREGEPTPQRPAEEPEQDDAQPEENGAE